MVHFDSKSGDNALTSCGKPITGDLHEVDWFDREQVNCPGCLQMLAEVEIFFNEIFLPDGPKTTYNISQAHGIVINTPRERQ